MQIDNQIAEAFKTKAMEITSPEELDARIIRRYEKQAQRERERTMQPKKKRILVMTIVGLIALMIMGFTVQYMVKMGDDRISLEYYASGNRSYDPINGSIVRGQLQQIKEQLKVGESAYVYSHEIAKLTPNLGDFLYAEYISNPYVVEDYEMWQQKLGEENADYKLPVTVLESLTFVGGEEEFPFGGVINQREIVDQLQDEIKVSGKNLAWSKIERDRTEFPVFTSVYRDENQEEVKVSMEIFTDKVKKVGRSVGTHERVMINGTEADYFFNNRFLYSESNEYQSLVWVETLEDKSIVYSIGSSGKHMTKERLISLGESME
jgi:hypothetical protein